MTASRHRATRLGKAITKSAVCASVRSVLLLILLLLVLLLLVLLLLIIGIGVRVAVCELLSVSVGVAHYHIKFAKAFFILVIARIKLNCYFELRTAFA